MSAHDELVRAGEAMANYMARHNLSRNAAVLVDAWCRAVEPAKGYDTPKCPVCKTVHEGPCPPVRETAREVLDDQPAKGEGGIPDTDGWACSRCGAEPSITDPTFRWEGQWWAHKCPDAHPQCGHFRCERTAPARPSEDEARRLQKLREKDLAHYLDEFKRHRRLREAVKAWKRIRYGTMTNADLILAAAVEDGPSADSTPDTSHTEGKSTD